jgi:alkylation response protein AidB-like acyl-CoA dehydrogenase
MSTSSSGRSEPDTPDEEALRDGLRSFFRAECPPAEVRSAPDGFSARLWKAWSALGPRDLAGDDNHLELAVAACLEAGAVMAPIPLAEGLVTNRLLAGTDGLVAASLLAEIDAGEVVSIAPAARSAGVLRHVPAGAVARRVLYRVEDRVLATADGPGTPLPNLGPLPVAHRTAAESDPLVGEGPEVSEAWLRAGQEWRICVTALALGAARRSLEAAVEYGRSRHQFGSPIGGFQAVAHGLADAATSLTGADLLLRSTVAQVGAAADRRPLGENWRVDQLVYFALTASERAATESLHYHGGYGFTLEHDVQLYLRHIKAWSLLLGGARPALIRAAQGRGWTGPMPVGGQRVDQDQ